MDPIGDLILYKNNQLIALNKPAGIPTQADKAGTKALIDLAEIFTKSPLHLIHRIDRPASGVVLFARNKRGLANLNEQVRNRTIRKTYLAIVGVPPEKPKGELVHFLRKNGRTNRSTVVDESMKGAKKATLKYELLGSSDRYHLLKINLETGRHHQIRAQLGAIGSPVRGDDKYGFKRSNKDHSIQLHAWKLSFSHPVTGVEETVVASPPEGAVWTGFGIDFDQ